MTSPTAHRTLAASLLFLAGLIVAGCYDLRDWFWTSTVHGAKTLPSPQPVSYASPVLRFIAVGDVGTGASGQRAVAESMAKTAEGDSIAFVLFLGDNFYESGVRSVSDPQWTEKFEAMYDFPSLQIPFLAVLGNHDYRSNPQAQVEYTGISTRWTMPARFFSQHFSIDDSTTMELFCLDTHPMAYLTMNQIAAGEDSSMYRPQLRWLEDVLSSSTATWKLAAGHHPLYSNGEHGDNPQLASLLEPLFTRYGVDAYLAGHDHDLQLLRPVQGVYYLISGAGGKHRDTEWKENTIFAATNLGYAVLGVSPSALGIEFFDKTGALQFSHVVRKESTQ